MKYGLSSLENCELIALVVKSGCMDRDVFELSADIIAAANGFQNLLTLNFEELTGIKGIKSAKALEIMAILEIAKRLSAVDRVEEKSLSDPGEVVRWMRFNIGFENTEKFMVIFLNTRGFVIRAETLFSGTRNASLVGIDEVMRKAILYKASGLIAVHNHPSGDPSPSHADIEITQRLKQAAMSLGLVLYDHIIVSMSDHYSFKREGLL